MAQDIDPVQAALETLARDLLFLIHTARSFPDGHPSAARVMEGIGKWTLPDRRQAVKLGISRSELVLDNRFYGTKKSRISELAALLNSRSLKSLKLRQGLTGEDLWRFARVVADRRVQNGKPLVEALKSSGLTAIEVEALDVAHIHNAMGSERSGGVGDGVALDEKARAQQAWLWLQAETSDPEAVAKALSTDELWAGGLENHEAVLKLGYILSGLGKRLDQGLDFLDPDKKGSVISRLSEMGKKVTPEELAGILANCPDALTLQQEGMSALLGDLEGDKLLDLMAGVVAAGKNSAERVNELLKHFSGGRTPANALSDVRSRLRSSDRHGYAVEVWKNLEELLLNQNYEAIMHDEYRASLGDFSKKTAAFVEVALDFAQPPDENLDLIHLGLAMAGGGILQEGWDDLFAHIRERASEGSVAAALKLVEATLEAAPYAISADPTLPLFLVRAGIAAGRALDDPARLKLRRFAERHSSTLFEPLLNSLKDVQKISSRRILVDVLASFPNDTTPKIISRARLGPWFITRNLLIVLGRRRDRASLPYLVATLSHEEPRVRREAMRALYAFGAEGTAPLSAFAADPAADPRDVRLALALAKRAAR